MHNRVFVSDLHLEDPDGPAFLRFSECLAAESAWADEIYILGDLVEMWIGDDDNSPLAERLREVLRRTAAVCPVALMHGNRDFLFGDEFARDCGVTLLADPHITDDGILLCHGDSLCTDDAEYQQMRKLLRSAAWQADILAKPLPERIALGRGMRAQSQAANANKAANIMDVNPGATLELLSAHNSRILVHGHTHRPGIHHLQNGSEACRRIVTGAWERCGWLCRQQQAEFTLECFTLARRYGT